jgi:alpha-ribazole phosphatase
LRGTRPENFYLQGQVKQGATLNFSNKLRVFLFMTRLILIRHGETDYSLQRKYCGFTDPPLNKNGIIQAEKLARRLKDFKINKTYSSDLKRTVQTAEILFKRDPIEKSTDFREINFGIFEGLQHSEIMKKYPGLYRDWIRDPLETIIPNGETLKDLYIRVKKRLDFIFSAHRGETVAVLTHAGPIKVILSSIINNGFRGNDIILCNFRDIKQDLCAINIIDYPYQKTPVIIKTNDTSHLYNSYKENSLKAGFRKKQEWTL